jgi:hypothetical protein
MEVELTATLQQFHLTIYLLLRFLEQLHLFESDHLRCRD